MSKRKDRERVEAGMRHRNGSIVSAEEARKVDKERQQMERVGVATIQAASTSSQVQIMSEALRTGRLSHSKLREALEENAPKEMSKGAGKLAKKGKPITVDALLEEYRGDKAFQKLASEVGLNETYFIELAEREISRRGGVDETGKKSKKRLRIFR